MPKSVEEDLQKEWGKENKLSIGLYQNLAFLSSVLKSEAIWCLCWFPELVQAGYKTQKTE